MKGYDEDQVTFSDIEDAEFEFEDLAEQINIKEFVNKQVKIYLKSVEIRDLPQYKSVTLNIDVLENGEPTIVNLPVYSNSGVIIQQLDGILNNPSVQAQKNPTTKAFIREETRENREYPMLKLSKD